MLHDGSSGFPELATALAFCERVITHQQALGRRVFFHLTGGEPTLYRGLPEMLSFVKARGAGAGLVSNGKVALRWWEKVAPLLDAMVLTYHVEFADLDHFIQVARLLSGSLKTHINVAMLPLRFDECHHHARRIALECEGATMTLKPLLKDFRDELYPYTDEQRRVIREGCQPQQPRFGERGVRGSMRCFDRDGESRTRAAADLVMAGDNRFAGWTCNAGIESIAVNHRGEVYRAMCQEGGLLGRIVDVKLPLPTQPIVCRKRRCSCLSDIMLTKWDAREPG